MSHQVTLIGRTGQAVPLTHPDADGRQWLFLDQQNQLRKPPPLGGDFGGYGHKSFAAGLTILADPALRSADDIQDWMDRRQAELADLLAGPCRFIVERADATSELWCRPTSGLDSPSRHRGFGAAAYPIVWSTEMPERWKAQERPPFWQRLDAQVAYRSTDSSPDEVRTFQSNGSDHRRVAWSVQAGTAPTSPAIVVQGESTPVTRVHARNITAGTAWEWQGSTLNSEFYYLRVDHRTGQMRRAHAILGSADPMGEDAKGGLIAAHSDVTWQLERGVNHVEIDVWGADAGTYVELTAPRLELTC